MAQACHHHHAIDVSLAFRRFVIAAVFTAPLLLMMVGFPLPLLAQVALASVVQLWCGAPIYRSTWQGVRHGSINMDLLIALGTTAAYTFSLCVWWAEWPEHVYFESSATIITLVLLGRWLEAKSQGKASEAIEKLLNLQPSQATVRRDGKWVEVNIKEVTVDDIFLVSPGEKVPLDGVVIEGDSAVDESMLTGESMPVTKGPHDSVFAATLNTEGALHVRATKVGADTALAGIIRLVEEAQSSRAPIQRLADRVSSVFVPSVIAISILTVLIWWSLGAPLSTGIINAVAVLVIACPCALGMATPTVIVVASGLGAQRGILFRDAAAIERAETLDTIIFDKTGTLTEGKPTVSRFSSEDPRALDIAYTLESHSKHPLARAITSYAESRGAKELPLSGFSALKGRGVRGDIAGKTYYLTSRRYAQEQGIQSPASTQTLSVLWSGDTLLGSVELMDTLRPAVPAAISTLEKMGLTTIMITGDHQETAQAIATQAGIESFIAEVLPDDKASHVSQYKEAGKIVGMVGDGINDAPALATADIGFAIGAGSDVAIEASDVTLISNNPAHIVDAILLSKATMRKIRQNLFFAFAYNSLGIPLAAVGLLNPIIAAAAMSMSSVSVITNALLLRRVALVHNATVENR